MGIKNNNNLKMQELKIESKQDLIQQHKVIKPIVIINPADLRKQSSLYPPLGLAQISAVLKKAGYKPKVIDLLFEENLKQIEDLSVTNGIYIMSFSTALVSRAKEIIKLIRTKDKNAFIMGGGAHPTARKEKTFDELDLDLIALGEVKIDKLVDFLHSEDWPLKLPEIKGVIYKHEGKVYINKPVDEWEDLDDIPILDQGAFPLDKYFKLKGFRELSIVSSRGCPYRCTFCQPILIKLFGPKVRFASVKKTVDEFEYLATNFKLDMIVFSDDTFAFHQERVIDMCKEIIKRKIPIMWRVQTRVGLRRDVLEWMKKAGCFLIAFGVESGSQKILDNVNKQATVDMIIDTFKNCKEIGLLTYAYLMIGNVGESKDTINDTIKLIKKIKPFTFNIAISTPYPGTYLYEHIKKNNIALNTEWSEYNHILPSSVTKLSDFKPEELPKLKSDMEKVMDKESEKAKDLMRLFLDKDFIYRIFNILIHNPTWPFRMFRLIRRALGRDSYGFKVSNPFT